MAPPALAKTPELEAKTALDASEPKAAKKAKPPEPEPAARPPKVDKPKAEAVRCSSFSLQDSHDWPQ